MRKTAEPRLIIDSSHNQQTKTQHIHSTCYLGTVSHHWGIATGARSSDTTRQGAGLGSQSPPSSRTQDSSHRNGSRGDEAVEVHGWKQRKLRPNVERVGSYLEPMVLCVHYSGHSD